MALITKRATGRFRCRRQKMDPFCVWSRLEPHGKALQRNEKGKVSFQADAEECFGLRDNTVESQPNRIRNVKSKKKDKRLLDGFIFLE